MPIRYPDDQRTFTLETTADDLPIGNVITLGAGCWLTVCPLCGCAHDVTTFKGEVYEPRCIVRLTHPVVYRQWLVRYPDAAKYSRVMLSNVEFMKAVAKSPARPKKAATVANLEFWKPIPKPTNAALPDRVKQAVDHAR